MPRIDIAFAWLAARSDPRVDDLLSEALSIAEPAYAERIARTLCARRTENAWAALLAHFPQLAPAVQDVVLADTEQFTTAAAAAIERPSETERLAALAAMDRVRSPRLAYLLPARLRDPVPAIRETAAALLRDSVDGHLEESDAGGPPTDARRAQQHALAQAVGEALTAFELHHRVEVLQAGLWLASDLDAVLWKSLANMRSRAAIVVQDHLQIWDHPRLAGFLLLALRHAEWRDIALARLAQWSTPAHAEALLRQTHLLDDPTIRSFLSAVAAAPFLDCWMRDFSAVPVDLRRHVPRWVAALGLAEPQRVGLLSACLREPTPDVRRAAVYGLAALDTPGARGVLRQFADDPSPEGRFAAWYLAGCEGHRRKHAPEPRAQTWERLWEQARRLPTGARAAELAGLRAVAPGYRAALTARFAGADAQDRLLALQIVAVAPLNEQFADEIKRLTSDAVESIARLARAVLQRVPGGQPIAPTARTEPVLSAESS